MWFMPIPVNHNNMDLSARSPFETSCSLFMEVSDTGDMVCVAPNCRLIYDIPGLSNGMTRYEVLI